jgi:hypothetical protein
MGVTPEGIGSCHGQDIYHQGGGENLSAQSLEESIEVRIPAGENHSNLLAC